MAAARAPGGAGCLTPEQGAALEAWGGAEPQRAERWRGARAEWRAARGDLAGADELLTAPGHDGSRLRVALASRDGQRAREAAEGTLLSDPTDVMACKIVATGALAEGDAFGAIEQAACGGARSPLLERVRADALDAAGAHEDAVAAYLALGAPTLAAAVLYQEFPERRAEAARLLEGGGPAEALHRGWLALLERRPVDLAGLDDSPPADLLRVAADPSRATDDVLARLATLDDPIAAALRARAAAARGQTDTMETVLAEALKQDPACEALHRTRAALRAQTRGDVAAALAEWAAQDPDHVRLRGLQDGRHRPWAAVAPWSWDTLGIRDPRARHDAPRGQDDVGRAYRTAIAAVARTDQLDALEALHRTDERLTGLVRERWTRASPQPP